MYLEVSCSGCHRYVNLDRVECIEARVLTAKEAEAAERLGCLDSIFDRPVIRMASGSAFATDECFIDLVGMIDRMANRGHGQRFMLGKKRFISDLLQIVPENVE